MEWELKYSLIILLIMVIILIALNPITHIWKPKYERMLGQCLFEKPELNITGDVITEFCYNKGWKDYCKYSYPDYCPKQSNKSFLDR